MTKNLTAKQISDEMMTAYLQRIVEPFRGTATKCLELAGGNETMANEAYTRYVDAILQRHEEYDAFTLQVIWGTLGSVFNEVATHEITETQTVNEDIRGAFERCGLDLSLSSFDIIPPQEMEVEGTEITYYEYIAKGKTTNGTIYHFYIGIHDEGNLEHLSPAAWESYIQDDIDNQDYGATIDEGADETYAEVDRLEIIGVYSALHEELKKLANK